MKKPYPAYFRTLVLHLLPIMEKMLKLKRQVVATILMLFLSGCYYDVGVEEITSSDTVVSFALDIQPILTTNCTTCHPVLRSPDLTVGNSYNAITNGSYIVPNDLEASVLYQKLLGNPSVMPPSGALPLAKINLVKSWIEQGALNN
jgi:hypothetical protein